MRVCDWRKESRFYSCPLEMPLKISEPSSNYKGEVESETYGRGSALLRNDRF